MSSSEEVLLVYSEDFKLHSPEPYSHPESPERLDKMLEGLKNYGLLKRMRLLDPPKGDLKLFLKVHSREYFNLVTARGRSSVEWLDGDTYISPGTHTALERLSGAAETVTSKVEDYSLIVLLPRPPGHHAGRNGRGLGAPTLGFCIFNISALIAQLVREREYKVAMLDFDAHHGNGTQDIFYDRKDVPHIDIHQDSATIYPGTGFPDDCGVGEARGSKINLNLPPLSGDDIFVDASRKAIEYLKDFDPDVIIVDAGFDGYRDDNYMVSLRAGSKSFNSIGKLLNGVKSKVKSIIVVVEGGYSSGLTRALPAFLWGILGKDDPVEDPFLTSGEDIWRRYKERSRQLEEAIGG
jgi:acetoin utilization deacetylase AcuC-like enzyme